jgi:hypothetical protein
MNEFTVYQSLVFPASIYPVLGRGGQWDPARDPFASRQNQGGRRSFARRETLSSTGPGSFPCQPPDPSPVSGARGDQAPPGSGHICAATDRR